MQMYISTFSVLNTAVFYEMSILCRLTNADVNINHMCTNYSNILRDKHQYLQMILGYLIQMYISTNSVLNTATF